MCASTPGAPAAYDVGVNIAAPGRYRYTILEQELGTQIACATNQCNPSEERVGASDRGCGYLSTEIR